MFRKRDVESRIIYANTITLECIVTWITTLFNRLRDVMVTKIQILLIVFLLIIPIACGPTAKPEAQVLLIGLDGIEMDVLKPLLKKGELPNMAKLIDRGTIGYLQTFIPTYSPVIWTTIATGKHPEAHNILDFKDRQTDLVNTSNARRGKAVWNIMGDYGLKTNVAGFWMTWPAEKINGKMVSQVTCNMQYSVIWKGMLYEDTKDATWPPELQKEIWPVLEPFQTPDFIQDNVLPRIFGDLNSLNMSSQVKKLISDSNWAIAGDYIYYEAGKYLMDKYPADMNIVYLGGTDVIAHRFWRYKNPELFKYNIRDQYIIPLGEAINNYYKLADEMVGELIKKVPENTRIIICSDHGMHADFLDGTDHGKPTFLSAHHMDGPPGVIIAAGDGIQKGPGLKAYLEQKETEQIGTVFDVTPTLLYLMDIPVGRDMKPGKIMTEKLISSAQLKKRPVQDKIETHDVGFRPPSAPLTSSVNDEAFKEKMKGLGYMGAGGGGSNKIKLGPRGKKR